MKIPPGFDDDPAKCLHNDSYELRASIESYPLAISELMTDRGLEDQDLAEAVPEGNVLDLLDLTLPRCPDHPSPRELFLAGEMGKQLADRIEEKFPDSVEDYLEAAMLAIRVLYRGIREAKEQQEKETTP